MTRTARTTAVPGALGSLRRTDADHALAAVAAVAAAVSLLLLAVGVDAVAPTYLGAVGLLAGLWGQMISRTRGERFLDVVGLVGSAMAVGIGASQGGLVWT